MNAGNGSGPSISSDGPGINESAQRFYERHGFIAVERTDGLRNDEREPDVRYVWQPQK